MAKNLADFLEVAKGYLYKEGRRGVRLVTPLPDPSSPGPSSQALTRTRLLIETGVDSKCLR